MAKDKREIEKRGHVSVSAESYDRFRSLCRSLGISMAEVVELWIDQAARGQWRPRAITDRLH